MTRYGKNLGPLATPMCENFFCFRPVLRMLAQIYLTLKTPFTFQASALPLQAVLHLLEEMLAYRVFLSIAVKK